MIAVLKVFLLIMTVAAPDGRVMVKVAGQPDMAACETTKAELEKDLAADASLKEMGATYLVACLEQQMPVPTKPQGSE